MTFRSPKLREAVHRIPCQADFEHVCTGRFPMDDGRFNTVGAHTNQLMFGRGAFHKSPDCFIAAVCPPAHDLIDGRAGGLDKDTKHSYWLRSYINTQVAFWTEGIVRLA